jgi:uncharacterized protein (TIGR02271 family)
VTSTPEGPDAPSVLRSEQHLRIDRQRVAAERVRVRRRVVSETRQLSVTVRREELVIDREPLYDSPVDTIGPPPDPLVFVLFEEVPVIDLRTRPYEEVTLTVELVTNEEPITTELDSEHIQVKTYRTANGDPPAPR